VAASLRDQLKSMGFEPIDGEDVRREPAVRVEHRDRDEEKVRLVRNGWEFPEGSIVIELKEE